MADSVKTHSFVDINEFDLDEYEYVTGACAKDSSDEEEEDEEVEQPRESVSSVIVTALKAEVRDAFCRFDDDTEDQDDEGDTDVPPADDPVPPADNLVPPVAEVRGEVQRPAFVVQEIPVPDAPPRSAEEFKAAAQCRCNEGECIGAMQAEQVDHLYAVHRSLKKLELDLLILGKLSVLIAQGDATQSATNTATVRQRARCTYMLEGKGLDMI